MIKLKKNKNPICIKLYKTIIVLWDRIYCKMYEIAQLSILSLNYMYLSHSYCNYVPEYQVLDILMTTLFQIIMKISEYCAHSRHFFFYWIIIINLKLYNLRHKVNLFENCHYIVHNSSSIKVICNFLCKFSNGRCHVIFVFIMIK